MGEGTETYERERLYEEVWKEPVLVVANRYGVSLLQNGWPPWIGISGQIAPEYAIEHQRALLML